MCQAFFLHDSNSCFVKEAWLDFFKNAHEYENIPANSSKIMKMAYGRIELKKLPANIKDLYLEEEVSDENYSECFKEEHRKGLQEGIRLKAEEMALNLRGEMSIEKISFVSKLSVEYIEDLFKRSDENQ